jgi:hypothetical protein
VATFLLTWSPRRWPWDESEDDLRDFRRDSYLDGHWSCGVTKHIAEGDRFCLIRLGEEPRGIVATGTVQRYNLFEEVFSGQDLSDVYEGPHWDNFDSPFVNVTFDKMLDPEVDVFPLDGQNASEGRETASGSPEREAAYSRGYRQWDSHTASLAAQTAQHST